MLLVGRRLSKSSRITRRSLALICGMNLPIPTWKSCMGRGKLSKVNCLPENSPFAIFTRVGRPTKDIRDYLATYMRGVKPRILSFDNYPLREANATVDVQTSAIREFINNLVLMRREALEAKIPFWGFIQSVGWPDNRLPTKNEMRWLNNMHVVFGADGFSYFLWADTDFYTGEPVTSQHLPTMRYDLIKQLNQEFRAYDFMVVPFHQNGFIVRNLDGTYLEAIPKSLQRATFGAVKAIETQGKMINGCFDFQGLKAVYLFNFDMVDPTHARVDFKARTRFELWGKGGRGLEKKDALSLEIFLEPGEGKLLVFRD
jgi:hypothetical protein